MLRFLSKLKGKSSKYCFYTFFSFQKKKKKMKEVPTLKTEQNRAKYDRRIQIKPAHITGVLGGECFQYV